MAKRAVLVMKAFYKAVIKDLQEKLLVEDVLLRALTCLNPLEQKTGDSLQYCMVVAGCMPSIQPEEEMKAGDNWIRYPEMNVTDDQSLHVDCFWKKCSLRKITVEISLKCCQQWSNVL